MSVCLCGFFVFLIDAIVDALCIFMKFLVDEK